MSLPVHAHVNSDLLGMSVSPGREGLDLRQGYLIFPGIIIPSPPRAQAGPEQRLLCSCSLVGSLSLEQLVLTHVPLSLLLLPGG